MSLYAQILVGVPNAVRAAVAALRDDETQKGDLVRVVLQSMHPDKVCQATLSGLVHHLYLITVNSDLEAGTLKRVLIKWPSILRLAAFKHDGLQVGQSYDASDNVTGTPTVTMIASHSTAVRAAWPAEYVVDGKLTPPNTVQGQIKWAL